MADLAVQTVDEKDIVYRLVIKYATTNQKIIDYLPYGALDDFIQNAYVFFMTRCYKNYNKDKAKLSTYVYKCISLNLKILMIQTKYNLTFKEARSIANNKNKMNRLILYPKSLDVCSSTTINNSVIDEDNRIKDFSLATEEKGYKNIEQNYTINYFNDLLDNYFKNYKHNKERDKNIILTYVYNDKLTLQQIADKYDISRQRIHEIINKFRKYAVKDKELRSLFIA